MTNLKCLYLTAAGILLAGGISSSVFAAETEKPNFTKIYDQSGVEVAPELAARVPKQIRDRGTLIIGSDNAYAPWEYLAGDDGQTPEGIDVDLGKAIAKTLGLEFQSQTAEFASILPALGAKYDLGMSAFSITPERLEAVNFVSYAETTALWVVRKGNPTGFDPADYCGSTVAVQTGTNYEGFVAEDNAACIAAGKPPIKVLPFKAQTEATTRLAAGGADATPTGGSTAIYSVLQSGGALEKMVPSGPMGKIGINGIAIAKSDVELAQLIADTLNHLIKTGVYREIYTLWGIEDFLVSEALVNPGPIRK